MRRVVVTGMGAITPIGLSVDEFWNSVKKGQVGIDKITQFDATEFKTHLAAEVKGFDAREYMDFKSAKRMERFSQFAVAAAKEAIEDAGLNISQEDPYMIGTSIGSGIGSLDIMEKEHKKLLERGPSRINPLLVPLMITNMAAGNVAIQFGLKGKSINVVTACATGTNSIGEAFRTIQYGDADVMIAGGTESSICPIGVAGFSSLTALSSCEDPTRCSIPFDKDRSGFVMGEGAAILVLEELEHALARGAKIYAEVVGYGSTCDAYHVTAPAEEAIASGKAIRIAAEGLEGVLPEAIYINAHGTGTPLNDKTETRAIKNAFGEEDARKVHISSTKSMTGHMLGAAGAVEAIAAILAVKEDIIPPTINLTEADPECDLDYTPNTAVHTVVEGGLSTSLGFGGHNACVAFRKVR